MRKFLLHKFGIFSKCFFFWSLKNHFTRFVSQNSNTKFFDFFQFGNFVRIHFSCIFFFFFFARLRSGTFVFCDATQSNVTCNLTNRWVRTQTRRVHDWRVDVSLLAANADCFISWTPFFLLFVVCRQQWCAHRYCCALEWDTTNNWSMYVANVCAYAHENEFDCVSFLRFVVCL